MTDISKKHPAKYNDKLFPDMAKILEKNYCKSVLDPFGGTGKIFELKKYLDNLKIFSIELEPEWANCIVGDAHYLPFSNDCFDAIVTSPTYGNRMADHHEAKDKSVRNTYTHFIGRKLSRNNSGCMQWGEEYRRFHKIAWIESRRVLKDNGIFILNIKDHIRDGVRQNVTAWHIECLSEAGFELLSHKHIFLSGNGMGKNREYKVPYESVIAFILHK